MPVVVSVDCETTKSTAAFGATAPDVWLSPLMSLYWFFSLPVVGNTHLFLESVRDTESIWDVSARVEGARKVIGVRSRTGIPI